MNIQTISLIAIILFGSLIASIVDSVITTAFDPIVSLSAHAPEATHDKR